MAGAGTPGREGTPMLTVVPDVAGTLPADGQPSSLIDQIVRDGARQMLAAALQAEVAAYIDQFAGLRDEGGRRLVVRNGTAEPRTVVTSAGAVEVTAPRVNDRRADPATGQRMRFSSAILPPWARKTPQVSEVLPLLYLHGLSSGGLRARARAVPRLACRAVSLDGDQADRDVERRGCGVHDPGPVRRGLRLPVGGRDPPGHPAGRGQVVPAGDDRGARRRAQGAGRPRRRLPRVRRVVGGPAARLRPPGHARPGAGGRGRGAGVLDGGPRGVPAGQDPALLVPQKP